MPLLPRAARNESLAALLSEARWTQDALGRAVNAIGAETGQSLRYDRTSVAHWLAGTHPRGQVPSMIAEAFSRKLKRVVRLADIGLASPRTSTALSCPRRPTDPATALADLAHTDLDPTGHATLRCSLYQLQALDIPDWHTARRTHPVAAEAPGAARLAPRIVDSARHILGLFAAADRCQGGGHARTTLIAYLAHDIAGWARTPDPDLLGLTADLIFLAGFRCFDDHAHSLAQRYYLTALAFAIEAADPIRYAIILCGLSQQAHYLGHHRQALTLATSAVASTAGHAPPHTEAFLHAQAAVCHALLGHHHTADIHQHHAEYHLAHAQQPAPIVGSYHPADFAYHTARVLLYRGETVAARAALRTAVSAYPAQHRRSRALALVLLTDLYLTTGDHRLARANWQRLLDDHSHLCSARVDTAVHQLRLRLRHRHIRRLHQPTPATTNPPAPLKRRPAPPGAPAPTARMITTVPDTASDTGQYQKYIPEVTSDTSTPADAGATGGKQRGPGALPTAVPAEYTDLFAKYEKAVSAPGGPLDADTVRAYLSRVRQYLAWLAAADVDGNPLTNPAVRDGTVRDYCTYLLTVAKRKLTTVNAHLTAIDDLYRHLGPGAAVVKRQEIPKAAPRALTNRARTRWLRAAQRANPRAKALAYLKYYAGLRRGEAVALDLDDVRISARKGVLIVRYGKGGQNREVPLHPHLRTALDEWIAERATRPGATDNPALFLNRHGGRLSTRGAYDELTAIAADANLEFSRDGDLTRTDCATPRAPT